MSKPQPERAAEINLELGIEYLRKGNLQQAKDKIDRALEQNPRNAQGAAGRRHAVRPARRAKQGGVALRARRVARAEESRDQEQLRRLSVPARTSYERGEKVALEAAANPLYKTPEVALPERRQLRAQRRRHEARRRALPQGARGAAALQRSAVPDGGARISADRITCRRAPSSSATWKWVGPVPRRCGWACASSAGSATRHSAQHYAQRLKS